MTAARLLAIDRSSAFFSWSPLAIKPLFRIGIGLIEFA
jgi:hypothetical protein